MASSVCKSLQYLTSALTQVCEGGHLFRLAYSIVLWGGRNTANKYHWHVGEYLQCMNHTGFAPSHVGCMCFPVLHCLGSRLLCWGTIYDGPRVACTSQIYATQVQVLGYSTKAQTQLGLHFVPYPGPSSSGDQVLGEHTLPKCVTSLVPAILFPGYTAAFQVCPVSLLGS